MHTHTHTQRHTYTYKNRMATHTCQTARESSHEKRSMKETLYTYKETYERDPYIWMAAHARHSARENSLTHSHHHSLTQLSHSFTQLLTPSRTLWLTRTRVTPRGSLLTKGDSWKKCNIYIKRPLKETHTINGRSHASHREGAFSHLIQMQRDLWKRYNTYIKRHIKETYTYKCITYECNSQIFLTHSLAHSLTNSLTHSRTHSLTHSLTHALTYTIIHSLNSHTHSPTPSRALPLTRTYAHANRKKMVTHMRHIARVPWASGEYMSQQSIGLFCRSLLTFVGLFFGLFWRM